MEVSCVKRRLEEQATVVFRLVAPLSNRYRTSVNQHHPTCPEGPMDRQVRRSQCTEKWQCTHELHSALSAFVSALSYPLQLSILRLKMNRLCRYPHKELHRIHRERIAFLPPNRQIFSLFSE